jgi:predicted Zn-dependent protease
LQAKHSRQFEGEADDFALRWLDAHGIARSHFRALLKKLEAASGRGNDDAGFLSTHPQTDERG